MVGLGAAFLLEIGETRNFEILDSPIPSKNVAPISPPPICSQQLSVEAVPRHQQSRAIGVVLEVVAVFLVVTRDAHTLFGFPGDGVDARCCDVCAARAVADLAADVLQRSLGQVRDRRSTGAFVAGDVTTHAG